MLRVLKKSEGNVSSEDALANEVYRSRIIAPLLLLQHHRHHHQEEEEENEDEDEDERENCGEDETPSLRGGKRGKRGKYGRGAGGAEGGGGGARRRGEECYLSRVRVVKVKKREFLCELNAHILPFRPSHRVHASIDVDQEYVLLCADHTVLPPLLDVPLPRRPAPALAVSRPPPLPSVSLEFKVLLHLHLLFLLAGMFSLTPSSLPSLSSWHSQSGASFPTTDFCRQTPDS